MMFQRRASDGARWSLDDRLRDMRAQTPTVPSDVRSFGPPVTGGLVPIANGSHAMVPIRFELTPDEYENASARGIRVQVIRVEDLPTSEPPLILCHLCAESVPDDSMPGMVYIGQVEDVDTEDDGPIELTIGCCERCGALHFECPTCRTVNTASEWRTDEWIECEGGMQRHIAAPTRDDKGRSFESRP
jgi:hypothetical protein